MDKPRKNQRDVPKYWHVVQAVGLLSLLGVIPYALLELASLQAPVAAYTTFAVSVYLLINGLARPNDGVTAAALVEAISRCVKAVCRAWRPKNKERVPPPKSKSLKQPDVPPATLPTPTLVTANREHHETATSTTRRDTDDPESDLARTKRRKVFIGHSSPSAQAATVELEDLVKSLNLKAAPAAVLDWDSVLKGLEYSPTTAK